MVVVLSSIMAYFLLVRHGQNEWVDKKRLAGWTAGVHLNETGIMQVAGLSQRLHGLPIQAIYSSPLERCLETAEPIAKPHHLTVQVLEALGEVRYGRWQGKKLKQLSKKKRKWFAVQHFPSRFRFPGGESFQEVQNRAVSTIEKLNTQHLKEIVVVVSHADVIKLILAYYLGIHIDLFQRITVSPASVSILALGSKAGVMVMGVNHSGTLELPGLDKKSHKKESDHSKATSVADDNGIIDSNTRGSKDLGKREEE